VVNHQIFQLWPEEKNVRSSSALHLYRAVYFTVKSTEQGAEVSPHRMMYDANINN
jgi:hypothetical protein